MAKKTDEPNLTHTLGLEDYKRKRAELEAGIESVKADMVTRFNAALQVAVELNEEYKAEFGSRIPSPFVITQPSPSTGHDGRALGGLKRALAAATKRGDSAKVMEVQAKIDALTTPAPEAPTA